MRIAQVAPLYESVPPRLYGGTERVVSYLTEELVRLGHRVTLFASGDSVTAAELVPCCASALRLDPSCRDPLAHHVRQLEQVFSRLGEFDVVHFHTDYLHFPLSRRHAFAHVTTLHGRLDLPDLAPLHREFAGVPLVSISDAQRRPLPWANWQATVYHGLPGGLHTFRPAPGTDLVFLGRISPEKGVDRAVEIAVRSGMHLKIAAKVDRADRDYFEAEVKPLLRKAGGAVEFVGEVGGAAKDRFLGEARAALFPIDWPEPFGLVMIESMACGTPVIAFPRGSVPEVMADGVTGFVVEGVDEAVQAVGRAGGLDRAACRRVFEERFSARRMALDYLAVYRRLAGRRAARRTFPVPAGSGDDGGNGAGRGRNPARPGQGVPAAVDGVPAAALAPRRP
jgi:glycosyltransferase involved in cell wall biosynthesis